MNSNTVNSVAATADLAAALSRAAPQNPAALARMMGAVAFSVVQFWLTVPLTSLILANRGVGAGSIGLFAMLPWLAVLMLVPIVPRLVNRMGALAVFRAGMVIAFAAMLLFLASDNLALWFLANFLNGAGNALRWVVSDALVTGMAPPERRGRILGLYETVLGACLLAAPFLLSFTGSDGTLPFTLAAALPLLAILPTIGLKAPRLTALAVRPSQLRDIAARHALPLLTIMLCGIVACGSYSLFPVYGRQIGLTEREAALWMALFGGGAVACQYAIGWLCDRWRRALVHRGLIGIVVAGLLLLPALDAVGPSLWLFNFVFGGAVTGLYTITMIIAGNEARDGELLTLITGITLSYTLGSIAGPALAGWALEIAPAYGLPLGLAGASAVVIAALAFLQHRAPQQAALQATPSQ
jgi:MFS family permease